MKTNVVYLLGAGASANALPIVKYFNARLELFLDFLKDYQRISNKFNDFISEVEFILNEAKNHSTIDTVAKKYFHTLKKTPYNLIRLKKVLSIFFLYEQMSPDLNYDYGVGFATAKENQELLSKPGYKQGRIDKRYDAFIASLLKPVEDNFEFPNEVGIITWNYDCQFELAFQQFCNDKIYDLQKKLNVYPLLTPITEPSHWNRINKPEFKILHLNGKAHTFNKKDNKYFSFLDNKEKLDIVLEAAINSTDYNNLTFSWERNSNNSIQHKEVVDIINSAESMVGRSQILVIIGYSFPFFNREVDKKLFREKSFEKIYIQDLDAENIKELFVNVIQPGIHPNLVKTQANINQFLLPPELDTE